MEDVPDPLDNRYDLEKEIGHGAMGRVFMARDRKIGRRVAIKLLPTGVRQTDQFRRFEQEARAAGALNHPNIVVVHDVGSMGAEPYIVSELLDGTTLRARMDGKPPPLAEALDFARQLAAGLCAAHDKGVLHRDLKPENLFITREGRLKILDFGIAKLISAEVREGAGTQTATGEVVGTVGYMSPEQLRGDHVDARTDIFSFGIIAYEMLAGFHPFQRKSAIETASTILRDEAPPLPSATPHGLEQIVRRCLAKDANDRIQSARELEAELAQVSLSAASPRWRKPAIFAAVVLALAAVALAPRLRTAHGTHAGNPLVDARFTRLTDFAGSKTNPAISPDGKFVAFIAERGGKADIWISQSNIGNYTNLTQSLLGDLRGPLRLIGFSGDGSHLWIAGTPERRLRLMPLVGGAPQAFLDEHAAEVAWSSDGRRLVYHRWDPGDPVLVADGSGANERLVVQNEPGLHNHFLAWSRDGGWIYFSRGRPATREMDLWRVRPEGGEPEQLTHLATDVGFIAPIDERTLLYVAHNEYGAGPWLWSFDLETRTARRASVGLEQYTALASSADGRRLAATVVNPQVSLWTVPLTDGTVNESEVKPVVLPNARALAPRFGGGALFYLSSRDGADGLWSYRGEHAFEIWSGLQGALQSPPGVTANGDQVVIAVQRGGRRQLFVVAADGTRLRPLSAEMDVRGTASFSPDGKWVVAAGSDREGPGIFRLPLDGGAPVRLASGAFLDPVWSPRGDLIVYGGTQVFTRMPLVAIHPDGTPATLPPIEVNREGERVRFLPDGSGFVYLSGGTGDEQDFWLFELKTQRNRRLTRLADQGVIRTFDVAADGSRIVFDRSHQQSEILLIDLQSP